MERRTWVWSLTMALVLVMAICAVRYPLFLLALVGGGAFAYLLAKPFGRLIIFAGGALAVFQSSSGTSAIKIAYFAAALGIAIIAVHRCAKHVQTPWGTHFRPALHGAALVACLVFIAGAVGTTVGGAPASEAARDGITYLLIAAAVPIAIDGASTLKPQFADFIVIAITLVAAASFGVAFLAARGVSSLAIDRIGLSSMMALSVGVSLGFLRGMVGQGVRLWWLLYAAALLACVLITGSRGGLVLLAALAVSVGSQRSGRIPPMKAAVGLTLFAAGLVTALLFSAPRLTTAGFLESRLEAGLTVLRDGAGQDQSGLIRARATSYALEAWGEGPLFGVGLGHRFPDPTPGGYFVDFQLDTALTLLAKFGIVGTGVLAIALALILRPAFKVHKFTGRRLPEQTIVGGAMAVWLVTLAFGAPTEDKGFSLAVLMSLMVLAVAVRTESLKSRPTFKPTFATVPAMPSVPRPSHLA